MLRLARSPAVLPLCVFAVSVALYLLLAGTLGDTELAAGAAAAGLTTFYAMALHRMRQRRLSLRAPWGRLVGRAGWAVAGDTVRVGAALLRAVLHPPAGPVGMPAHQPFRHGGDADAGRRALVTLAASIAPNGFVLRVADAADVLVLHRLAATPPSVDRDWPV